MAGLYGLHTAVCTGTVFAKFVCLKSSKKLDMFSVVTVSKCFPSVGFGRFCRKNLGFRFGLGFHDKHVVNFFMTRVIWHDFHHR